MLQRTFGNRATTALLARQRPRPDASNPALYASPAALARQPESAEATGEGVSPAQAAWDEAVRASGISQGAIMGVLGGAGEVLERIVENPVGFANTLVGAVRQGIQQFAANIGEHLVGGLGSFLRGMGGVIGIPIPQDFGPRGIVAFAFNVLGIGADAIRERLSSMFGLFDFGMLGRAWDAISSLLGGGIEGLLDAAMDRVGGLANLVLDQLRSWLVDDLVQAAIGRLMTVLNPAGSVLQAITNIYRTMTFLRDRAADIAGLVEVIAGSLIDLAGGNMSRVIAGVEGALARAMPQAISFLANVLGLGDIGARIREVIERIREPIERGIDGIVHRVIRGARGVIGEEEAETAPPVGE